MRHHQYWYCSRQIITWYLCRYIVGTNPFKHVWNPGICYFIFALHKDREDISSKQLWKTVYFPATNVVFILHSTHTSKNQIFKSRLLHGEWSHPCIWAQTSYSQHNVWRVLQMAVGLGINSYMCVNTIWWPPSAIYINLFIWDCCF